MPPVPLGSATRYILYVKEYATNIEGKADIVWLEKRPEPEFLKILKCDLAESASTGFQFNCLYF
jgi:hypothetical protein